jgi:NACHT domain
MTSCSDEKLLALLPRAVQATFNSHDRQHDPICLPDTRVDVLAQIMAWADHGSDETCVFWLNGMAGTGKSTIARTISRKFYGQSRLGASFFFSKGGADASHAGKFFTSIAVQLANKSASLGHYICEAIVENRGIASQSFCDQWDQLVLGPLSKLDNHPSQSPLILVVDALDECEDENDIRIIVQLLAKARSLRKFRLRVFLTSRPEVPIRYGFYQIGNSEYRDLILHNISPAVVDHDITIFLEYSFRTIREERTISADWPGEQAIGRLVQNAGGLFIWAATACRFIYEGRQYAAKRLSMILQESESITAPQRKLNDIYITVLRNSVGNDYEEGEQEELYRTLRQILGSIVLLYSPLSAISLAKLLDISEENVEQTLEDLHAILDIPKQSSRAIRLHHPSFRDFILSKDRCSDTQFWVDEEHAHGALADACIQLLSTTLKRDVCSLRYPGALTKDVESCRVDGCLPLEVQYACLYWIQHLQKGRTDLYNQIHQLLQEHLVHWLEALCWMGKTSEGILAITSLESHIVVSHLCRTMEIPTYRY